MATRETWTGNLLTKSVMRFGRAVPVSGFGGLGDGVIVEVRGVGCGVRGVEWVIGYWLLVIRDWGLFVIRALLISGMICLPSPPILEGTG
jgi:hypothetical protein